MGLAWCGEGPGVQDGVRDLLQGPVGAVTGPVQQLPGLRTVKWCNAINTPLAAAIRCAPSNATPTCRAAP